MSGEVEEQVRFDKRAIRTVVENNLLIRMTVHILIVEVGVEFRVDFEIVFIVFGNDVLEARPGGFFAPLTLFREAFGAEQFGGGEGRRPLREKDVVLEVGGDEVSDLAAEGGDRFPDFWG